MKISKSSQNLEIPEIFILHNPKKSGNLAKKLGFMDVWKARFSGSQDARFFLAGTPDFLKISKSSSKSGSVPVDTTPTIVAESVLFPRSGPDPGKRSFPGSGPDRGKTHFRPNMPKTVICLISRKLPTNVKTGVYM